MDWFRAWYFSWNHFNLDNDLIKYRINMFNCSIDTYTMDETLQRIDESIQKKAHLHHGGKRNMEKQLFTLISIYYWMENNAK